MTMALSWTRVDDFNKCPRVFQLKYVDKAANFMVDSTAPALVRGNNVHDALEEYVQSRLDGITPPATTLPEVERTKPLLDTFLANWTCTPERQISVNASWNVVDWFSKASYYRAIFDFIAVSGDRATVFDYKTGKMRNYTPPSGFGQLELSTAMAFSMFPEVRNIEIAYLYVDHKKRVAKSYSRDAAVKIMAHFDETSRIINATTVFDPKKGENCRYCQATKSQCPYGTAREE